MLLLLSGMVSSTLSDHQTQLSLFETQNYRVSESTCLFMVPACSYGSLGRSPTTRLIPPTRSITFILHYSYSKLRLNPRIFWILRYCLLSIRNSELFALCFMAGLLRFIHPLRFDFLIVSQLFFGLVCLLAYRVFTPYCVRTTHFEQI